MSKEKLSKIYSPAEVKRKRRTVGAAAAMTVAAGLLLAAVSGRASGDDKIQPPRNTDETTICEVSAGKQSFVFGAGDGVDSAVHMINGSGSGETDTCWPEAKKAVEEELNGYQPQFDQQIYIPLEVTPIDDSRVHKKS